MRSEKIFLLRCLGEDVESVFQAKGIPFSYNRSRLTGEGTVTFEEYKLPLIVSIDQMTSILTMTLGLPVEFPPSGEAAAAQAITLVNNRVAAGCCRMRDGLVSFRVSTFFRDSRLSIPALTGMLDYCLASQTFLLTPLRRLAAGELTLEQFSKLL